MLLYELRQPEQAAKSRQRQVSVFEKLAADYPNDPVNREHLGHSYRWLAFDLQNTGQPAEAEKAFRRAIVNLQKLVDDFPDKPNYRGLLADTYDRWRLLLIESSVKLADLQAGAGGGEDAEKTLDEAIKILKKPVEFGIDPSYPHLLLCLRAGQLKEYRRLCAVLLDRHGQTEDRDKAVHLGICCKLGPAAVADLTVPLKLVDRAVAKQPKNRLFLGIQAHLLNRSGKFVEAAKQLEELIRTDEPNSIHHPFNKVILAMVHHRLGNTDRARKFLDEAKFLKEPAFWYHQLELEILRHEAEEQIGKKRVH